MKNIFAFAVSVGMVISALLYIALSCNGNDVQTCVWTTIIVGGIITASIFVLSALIRKIFGKENQ
jgi:hypothetical protein